MRHDSLRQLQQTWQQLDPRLQRLLKISGPIILLLAMWSLLWLPSQQQRHALQSRLPALRQQWAQMQAEASAIQTAPASHSITQFSQLDELVTDLNSAGLAPRHAQAEAQQWQLQWHAIDYRQWLQWLRQSSVAHGLALQQLHIQTQHNPQRVDIEAVFTASPGDPS